MSDINYYSSDGGTTKHYYRDKDAMHWTPGLDAIKDTVGWTGKNRAFSQTNNAVVAYVESGGSYKVSWTGSATITLKKNSSNGTEITSGSTSPLTFTADANYGLYLGSSAAVTQIMVYDASITDDTYEDYHEDVIDTLRSAEVVEGKNKLPNYCISGSTSGITWVKYADGTVVLNGTAEADVSIYIVTENNAFSLSAGQYYVSGCPDDINVGSDYVAQFILTKADGSQNYAIDNGTGVSWNPSADLSAIRARIKVFSGKTVSNAVFKPMICTASEWEKSHTYEPYYVPVKDRVDELDDDKLDASALAPIENGSTASQAYNAGDYLIRDNELYIASFDITIGESLVVNTNITKSTLNRIVMGSIVANSDLDNYYRAGRYCCGSSAAAQSLTHKPSDISTGFVMDVYNGPFLRSGQSIQMTTQIIMCVNTAIPAIYMRQKAYNGSFSNWYKFSGTEMT